MNCNLATGSNAEQECWDVVSISFEQAKWERKRERQTDEERMCLRALCGYFCALLFSTVARVGRFIRSSTSCSWAATNPFDIENWEKGAESERRPIDLLRTHKHTLFHSDNSTSRVASREFYSMSMVIWQVVRLCSHEESETLLGQHSSFFSSKFRSPYADGSVLVAPFQLLDQVKRKFRKKNGQLNSDWATFSFFQSDFNKKMTLALFNPTSRWGRASASVRHHQHRLFLFIKEAFSLIWINHSINP